MRVLAIDQGTSATKAVVVEHGILRALAEVPVHPAFLPDGRVEQDPAELLESVLEAGGRACAEAGGAVDAVALANQGETVLAWDRERGTPLTTAIVWQDGRAQSVCDAIRAADGSAADLIAERTGLVLDPYFSAPKMTWIREHLSADGVVTTTDAWLVHALTGAFVTDATTASRSLLLDLDRGVWDDELLTRFDLAGEFMPGDQRFADDEIAVAPVEIIMEVRAADAAGADPDLDRAVRQRRGGKPLEANVAGSVDDAGAVHGASPICARPGS